MAVSMAVLEATVKAVREHEGSYRNAAQSLSINTSTVYRRMQRAEELNLLEAASDRVSEQQLADDAEEQGFNPDDCGHYWIKTKTGSYHVRRNNLPTYAEMRDRIIADMKAHAPKYDYVEPPAQGDGLLVINPADLHINKLCQISETGYEYNCDIAVARCKAGIFNLVAKAKMHGVEQILFCIGNDLQHFDGPFRKTTAGTPQDTDGHQWWSMFQIAKECMISIIETLAAEFNVTLLFVCSNHDYTNGYFLADTIGSWFRNNPNVNVGYDGQLLSVRQRKYVEYGNNLIGFEHGDGAKTADLASLMQFEAREAWGRVKFGYFYTGHLHHKIRAAQGKQKGQLEKDLIGVTLMSVGARVDPKENIFVETLRSPSPPDGWHSRNAYINMCAIEVFMHHYHDGQTARFTEFF